MLLVSGKALGQSNGLAISYIQHIEPDAEETWAGQHGVWYGCGEVTPTVKLLAWTQHMALPLIFQGKDFATLLGMWENAAFSATTLLS